MGIVKKLAAIRLEIRNIEKRGHNAHFNYDFMRAQDVAGDIGDALAAQNIVIGKENLHVSTITLDKGILFSVTCDYMFIDGDSGDRLVVASAGAGFDSTDKGMYKALTGALKYALTQALCMRVGDDPEEDGGSVKAPLVRGIGHVLAEPAKALRANPEQTEIGQSRQQTPTALLEPKPYMVTAQEVDTMKAHIKATGTDEADVLKHFGVASLDKMAAAQFTQFCHIMDRKNAGRKP